MLDVSISLPEKYNYYCLGGIVVKFGTSLIRLADLYYLILVLSLESKLADLYVIKG